jgi:hypothetical protein
VNAAGCTSRAPATASPLPRTGSGVGGEGARWFGRRVFIRLLYQLGHQTHAGGTMVSAPGRISGVARRVFLVPRAGLEPATARFSVARTPVRRRPPASKTLDFMWVSSFRPSVSVRRNPEPLLHLLLHFWRPGGSRCRRPCGVPMSCAWSPRPVHGRCCHGCCQRSGDAGPCAPCRRAVARRGDWDAN